MKIPCSLIEPLEARIAPATLAFVSPTTATYTDADGDLVTVKFSKPILSEANVGTVLVTTPVDAMHDQLQRIDLTVGTLAVPAAGTSITVTVQPVLPGDSFADVGYINATGIDLGSVKIRGDLGAIDAGDATTKTPGVKGLTVQSLGFRGTATGAPDLNSDIVGALTTLVVKGNVRAAALDISGGTDGKLRSATIGGSLIGTGLTRSGSIHTSGDMGMVRIGVDLIAGGATESGAILSDGSIKSVTIGNNVQGGFAMSGTGLIRAVGKIGAVSVGGDLIGGTANTSGAIIGANLGTISIAGVVTGASNSGGTSFSDSGTIAGTNIAKLTIGGLTGGSAQNEDLSRTGYISATGTIKQLNILGDITGGSINGSGSVTDSGTISADRIAKLTVTGSITAGLNSAFAPGGTVVRSAAIVAGHDIGSLAIRGNVVGGADQTDGTVPVVISASGQISPTATKDVAIGTLTILGDVSLLNVLAGFSPEGMPVNGGAQIGKVLVNGNWIGSNLVAGAMNAASTNKNFGDDNDAAIVGGSAAEIARIGAIAIGGVIGGTAGGMDHFGFVTQQIGSFSIGGMKIVLPAAPSSTLIGATGDVRVHLI